MISSPNYVYMAFLCLEATAQAVPTKANEL